MKKIKELVLNACGITVLILTLFYAFVSIDTGVVFQMTFSSFLIVFGMSCLISLSRLILEMESFPYYVRLILHFTALLALILSLLGFTGYLAGKKVADYFVLIAAYAFIYAIVSLIAFGIRKLCEKIESKTAKSSKPHNGKNGKAHKNDTPPTYKSLYK